MISVLIAAPLAALTSLAEAAAPPVALEGALGARWVFLVGDESSLTRYDPLATEAVLVAPAALEATLSTGPGIAVTARVEEGQVHAGGLEAAEAHLAAAAPGGWGEVWIGRNDLAMTWDRAREVEQWVFSGPLLLPRISSPQHPGGVGATARWPERAALDLGVSYPSAGADAPWTWARLSLHPLGAPPAFLGATSEGWRIAAAGSAGRLDSSALGTQLLLSADLELRRGGAALAGGWIRLVEDDTREELWVEAGARLLAVRDGDLHAQLRGERVTGLPDEDARLLGGARLALRSAAQRGELFLEGHLSREQGRAAAPGEDVVVLDDSIERRNDTLAAGARVRFF